MPEAPNAKPRLSSPLLNLVSYSFISNSPSSPKQLKTISNLENQSFLPVHRQYGATLKGLHSMISDIRVVCPLMTVATMKTDIPFYISTFPRDDVIADADNDAAAILGFFPKKTPQQERHLHAMQQLFNHFVWNGEVNSVDSGKRILIVDQDVLPRAGYENCKLWVDTGIVPTYARVD